MDFTRDIKEKVKGYSSKEKLLADLAEQEGRAQEQRKREKQIIEEHKKKVQDDDDDDGPIDVSETKKIGENEGFLGTGLFSKSPKIDFAEAPEAEEPVYDFFTGMGQSSAGLKGELSSEEARKAYEKELAKQLARERKRQIKEEAEKRAKRLAEGQAKGRGEQAYDQLVGGGGSDEIDLLGSAGSEVGRGLVSGEGSSEDEIPLI